jgi:hypothetical protein
MAAIWDVYIRFIVDEKVGDRVKLVSPLGLDVGT